MRPVTDFSPEYAREMAVHWPGSSVLGDLERGIREHPQRVAIVDYRSSTGEHTDQPDWHDHTDTTG